MEPPGPTRPPHLLLSSPSGLQPTSSVATTNQPRRLKTTKAKTSPKQKKQFILHPKNGWRCNNRPTEKLPLVRFWMDKYNLWRNCFLYFPYIARTKKLLFKKTYECPFRLRNDIPKKAFVTRCPSDHQTTCWIRLGLIWDTDFRNTIWNQNGEPLSFVLCSSTLKHCQRHNGPEGWVHITCSNTNLDQISSSESRPSINFKISTKHQPLHKS